MAPTVLGVFIVALGIVNMRGNLSSIHWYHRRRVTEENRLAFGRTVGLGTIVCGASLTAFGCLSAAAERSGSGWLLTTGSVLVVVGLIAGLGVSFYGMIRYNRGIF